MKFEDQIEWARAGKHTAGRNSSCARAARPLPMQERERGCRSHRGDDDDGRDRSLIQVPTTVRNFNTRFRYFTPNLEPTLQSFRKSDVVCDFETSCQVLASARPPLESRQRLADASKNLAKLRLMCIRMLRSPASARRVKGPSLASATLSAIIYYCTSVCADDEELYHK